MSVTEILAQLDAPQFKVKGNYQAKCYDGRWCVTFEPTANPYGYSPPSIVANCTSESEAKELKRALQNSLNHQARKHRD